MQGFVFRGLLVLVAIFSIIIFLPMVLDMVKSKNQCDEAVLTYAEASKNPDVPREELSELEKKYEGICKAMGVKAEVYTSMLNNK